MFSRIDELNRFIRTKEFLNISKSQLSKMLNNSITGTYSQEILDCMRMSLANGPFIGFKFYVDTTGNNNILVKTLLKRRSWLSFSNEPLFPNMDAVHIIWT
jgi:hypothetical protein